jgi:hypothetical protein
MSPRNAFENNEDPVVSDEVEIKVDGRVVGYGVYDPETGTIQGAFTTEEVWIDPEDRSISFGVKKDDDPHKGFLNGQEGAGKKTCGCGKYQGCDVCRKYRS